MDVKSHILYNQGKFKIKLDKSIPLEKCSKIDYGNLTLGLINLYKRAKVIFPLMSYLRLKGLTTVEIEEVNGLIWGLIEKKGIL